MKLFNRLSAKGILLLFVIATLWNACVSRPWRPVNVGREYGEETTPLMVSHLPEKNQWTLARTKSHTVFQRILCFNYTCRRMIGRNKSRQAISMKDFKKRIAKNSKEGAYKNMTPVVPVSPVLKKQNLDSLPVKKDTARIARAKSLTRLAAPLFKNDSLITLSDFLFETDSYRLKDNHYSQLDSLSSYLLSHPTLEVSVYGHTDKKGNEKHNVTLSARRAEVVAHYLIDKGVPDEKIIFEGFGSSRPIGSNDAEAGRRKNRRVEILIRKPQRK